MIRVERSANYYRFLHTTYSLFIRFRGNTYRFSLLHRQLPITEIQEALYASFQEQARLRDEIKALKEQL